MVIVIQDSVFSSRSLLEVFISTGKCLTASGISVAFFLSVDLNYIKSLLCHNHVHKVHIRWDQIYN